MADILVSPDPPKEAWSWKKFFSGIFNGLNTAKALMTTFHQILIIVVVASVIWCGILLFKHFTKPKPKPTPICVTTNSGKIHSSTDDNKRKFGLINIF